MKSLIKLTFVSFLITLASCSGGSSSDGNTGFERVIISEVSPLTRTVELYNGSDETVNLSDYWFCVNNGGGYIRIGDSLVVVESGSLAMAPEETVVINLSNTGVAERISNLNGADVALYSTNDFPNPDAMVDYVQFGDSAPSGRESVALMAGLWLEDEFVAVESISSNGA